MNKHSNYIDERLKQRIKIWEKHGRYKSYIYNTRKGIITDFSTTIFTNETKQFFTKTYMRDYPCADCGGVAQER